MNEVIKNDAELEVVDSQAIMQEFDRESNVRVFTGWRKKIITALMASFSLYMIAMALVFPTATKYTKLTTFMAFIMFIGFLIFPAYKSQTKKINHVPFYDIILAIAGSGCFLYYTIFQEEIIMMSKRIGLLQMIVALVAILLLVELVRRAVGLPIIFVAGAFVVYAAIKAYLDNPDTAFRNLMYGLFYDVSNGLFSTPVYVCTTFIVLFIILGALLEKTGIGTFFVDLANSIAGSSVGGPAKVAVISSALEGMYSGSSVANTVGSGSITIPMMKKTGYKPEFAAAVEAAASTGGQIMPPIMGAAAFLMSEMTEESYSKIAIAAILPAVLYFMGIFLMIHFEAKKLGLKGLPKDAIPNFFKLILKNGYLLLPIVVLVICMNYFSAGVSACFAILASLIVSLVPRKINKNTAWRLLLPVVPVAVTLCVWGPWLPVGEQNMSIAVFAGMIVCAVLSFVSKGHSNLDPETVIDSLENGAKNTVGVAVACGMAGLISGVVTMTALGQLLINTLVPVAQDSMFLALVLTMLCCIVLGMGVPTTANYVIMATTTAPILIGMGIPTIAAHMFVFYFGIVADITPPVALAAYAGSAIAKSNPLKTGVTATRLAITAFIVPYIFAYSPQMLIGNFEGIPATPWYEIVLLVITAIFGIIMVSAGMEGYFFKKMPWWQRIIALAGGLCMVIPGLTTDIIGVALAALLILLQSFMGKKKNAVLSVVSVVVVLGIIAGALAMYFTRYHKDENDTEEFYMQNIESAGYENTVETAYPQTALYGIIEEHFKSALPEGKTEKKVVIIGYDGCRADILAERNDEGAVSYLLENGASYNLTYCGGVNYPAQNTQDTSTAPGWCSIVTGTWADVNGITGNGITKSVEPKTLMTSLVEEGTIDSSAFITKWKGHFTNDDSTYRAEKEYCEENNINVDFELRKNKEDIHTGAMEEITSTDCADFVFIVYEDTDSAGHDFGFSFNNPVYKDGFNTEDAYGYEVIKAIEARESYETEDWLIIVTSDHGGFETGHGGPSIQERMTFVVMNKEWN